ncbi:MAG TPA: CHAD domain-containing protein [Edaphobacter sp.]|nr:CHAD domain-containing protein [Edaphobacter sp.]
MAVSTTSAYPIRTLREHVTALEAAITLCLAEPKAKSVHRLRTTTRRIEGQLAMLQLIPGIPKHDKLARRAKRTLKKLRRAAGDVRDIDVQIDLIASLVPEDADRHLQADARELGASLEEDREDHAKKLLKILGRKQADLALTLESLLETLQSVERIALTSTKLTALTQQWYRDNTPPEPRKGSGDPDHLHAIRKVAKLARYMAENGPKQAKMPRQLAESFESLQQSGGEWHDWLVLADLAEDRLGSSSPLTKILRRHSLLSLAAYRRHLSGIAV